MNERMDKQKEGKSQNFYFLIRWTFVSLICEEYPPESGSIVDKNQFDRSNDEKNCVIHITGYIFSKYRL